MQPVTIIPCGQDCGRAHMVDMTSVNAGQFDKLPDHWTSSGGILSCPDCSRPPDDGEDAEPTRVTYDWDRALSFLPDTRAMGC